MRVLNELGWDWRENGAIISVVVDGRRVQWFMPLNHIRMVFGQELAAVGCPLLPSVGDPPTVGGFFKSLSRGIKRAARGVSRGVKKAAKSVSRVAKRGVKAVVPKAIRKAARAIQRTAMKGYRAASGALKKGLHYAGYVPVLGNVARLAKSGLDVHDRAMSGRMPTLKQLGRVAKQAGYVAADYIAPGSGTLAQAAIAAGTGLASGQRWDRALKAGGVAAASRYAPEAVVRGALKAGEGIASGQRWDRALKAGGMQAASHYVPPSVLRGGMRAAEGIASGRRVDRALTSGALTAASGYIPGGKLGQQAFGAARDLASGKRVDRVLKKRMRKVVRQLPLKGVIPNRNAFAAAHRALAVARDAEQAAQRIRRGYHQAQDAHRLIAGRATNKGIQELAKRARRGDMSSAQFMSAVKQIMHARSRGR